MSHAATEFDATAAGSGEKATERFLEAQGTTLETPKERVSQLATEVLTAVHDVIRRNRLTYDEYQAVKGWLIQVGDDGEWPLFMDVWVEHVVEEVATDHREGSKGSIEGPYYVPGSPKLAAACALPMREDEPGTPLLFRGQVTDVSGHALPGATIELWHADDFGFYSQFAPGLPEWNLRGTIITDDSGHFAINTVQPAPYQIPTDGSCGRLIEAAGWHAWRPAHIHLKVSAPGHELLTAQLYFQGDEHLEDDIATAVKAELIIDPRPNADGTGNEVAYNFTLDPVGI
jgi:catechol 1,2-dioxygenase